MVATNKRSPECLALRKKVKKYGMIGGLMTGIGGFMVISLPMLITSALNSQFVISSEGNDITAAWMDVPLPITNNVYVWNLENPEEFRRGAKPVLKEMGPYSYTKHVWKEIISWGPNEESVKYWFLQSWQFNPEKTVGDRNDKITIVNVPVYAMAAVVNGLVNKLPLSFAIAPVAFGFVNVLFLTHGEGLLKTLTVKELIEGYTFSIIQTIDTITKPLSWLGIQLPDTGMPQNKFGLLHVKNYTKGGPYEVWTGKSDPDKFGKFITYQGKKTLEIYDDPKCNMLNGTEGVTFGKYMTTDDIPYVFNGDACRALNAKYKGLSQVKGIPTWRFVLPKTLFAGPNKNPANKCFCTTPEDYDKCDGIFDVGPCQMGAPLAFSFPHLWHTSSKIQSGVIGMNPNPEIHESFFDVNPILGAPVAAAGRLQVNLLMKPLSLVAGFGGFRETVLPFVWLEETVGVEGSFETMMRTATYALMIVDWGPFLSFIGGLGVLGYTSYFSYKKRKIIFAPKADPSDPFNSMERQMETKTKNLYPNLFTVNGNGPAMAQNLQNPPQYNESQQQHKRDDRPRNGSPRPPINGVPDQNQQRSWSPPGATE